MKQYARALRAVAVAGLSAVVMLGAFASVAMADFDVIVPPNPIATSRTNPSDSTDAETWWRIGWGTDLHPQFTLTAPTMNTSTNDGVIIGTAYTVDRDLAAYVVATDTVPQYRTGRVTGTYFDNTLDMLGILTNPPSPVPSGWSASSPMAPIEGKWYYHWTWISSTKGRGQTPYTARVGVDVSPPDQVTGLAITPGPGAAQWSSWLPTTRALLGWDFKKYDSVSGVGYYQILIDGQEYIPEAGETAGAGRVYAMDNANFPDTDPFTLPTAVTIERMPAGQHFVQVAAVDRATNVGVASVGKWVYSDPDTPTVVFTSPSGGLLTDKTLVAVDAADQSGDPRVVLTLYDPLGGVLATKSFDGPPYQWTPGITPTTTGTYRVVASVSDHLRTVTQTLALDGTSASGFFPTSMGGLGTAAPGSSTTNPDLPNDSDLWWRQGWGNSLTPDFTLQPPSTDSTVGPIIGMLYDVDRVATTTLDPTRPNLYDRAARGTGTNLSRTLDMFGINAYGSLSPPGSVEGRWYLHSVFFTSQGYASPRTDTLPFGIDIRPPGQVTSLTVSPSLVRSDTGTWTASSRAVLSWKPAFDELSGVAYYQVLIDGLPVVPEGASSPAEGRVYELSGKTPSSVTIEDMPAGKHIVGIKAVDRATNESSETTAAFYSDPDTPTVSFTSPLDAALKPGTPISVDAADAAGILSVGIKIQGSTVPTQTFTAPPYSFLPDLPSLPPGTYTLRATATDHMGRTATATKVVTWDTVTATIGSVSPNPAIVGQPIVFTGHGTDLNGHTITAWAWRSSLDGALSSAATFSASNLSVGTHTIYFKAQCANGTWSDEQQIQLVVNPAPDTVTATINYVAPNPVTVGQTVTFTGSAADSKGHAIAAYQWRSSVSGVLSTSATFSRSNLAAGTHTIYFKAQCANGTWSPEVSRTLVVNPITAVMLPVYRFYNFKAGVHFYTADTAEKDRVMNTMKDTYNYEGVAYSINTANPANDKPLYRFYNSRAGVHFYTASETEKNNVLSDPVMSAYITLDGVAYYVSDYSLTATTVYRFYNIHKGVHFYTASEAEKNSVISNLASTYRYEGPGFYFEAN